MTRGTMMALLAGSVWLTACGGAQQADTGNAAATETMPAQVTLAVAVARGIDANPAAADSILAAHNLTAAGLDSLMYTIAEDSALAAAYTRATR